MNQPYQASGQNKPAAAKWLWITLIAVIVIGGAFAAWYYLIGPGKAVESSTATTTTTAPVDETADWKTYTNTVKNFSFKYPKDWTESTNSTDKTKVTTVTVQVIVEKISDIGSVPSGYDTTTALKDQAALKNNDPSTPIAQAVSSSYKMLKITGAVGKEFVILGQIDATDVQLVREAMIYTDDGYRIRIMADYNNDTLLETNNSSYFKADASGVKGAENQKMWNNKDQFYTDLVAGKTDSLTQTWYKNFTTSLSTFKFTTAAASATASTADWKTYTNTTYGYTIKYPTNFTTLDYRKNADGTTTQTPEALSINNGKCVGIGISVAKTSQILDQVVAAEITKLEKHKTVTKSAVKVSNVDATKLVTAPLPNTDTDCGNIKILVVRNSYLYTITGDTTDTYFDNLLSTFQFTK